MRIFNYLMQGSVLFLLFVLSLQTRYIFVREIGGVMWEYGSYSLYLFDVVLVSVGVLFASVWFWEFVMSCIQKRCEAEIGEEELGTGGLAKYVSHQCGTNARCDTLPINKRVTKFWQTGQKKEEGIKFLTTIMTWIPFPRFSSPGMTRGGGVELAEVDVEKIEKDVYSEERNDEMDIKKYWFLIAGLELFIIVSVFFANDRLLGLYGYLRFLIGVGVFALVIRFVGKRKYLIWAVLCGGFLQAVLGIIQVFLQAAWSNKYLGVAEHLPEKLGTSVVETMEGKRWLRAYGGLDHPNILGGFMVVCCLMLILVYINKKKNVGLRSLVMYGSVFFVFVLALFFSFSRSAWLAMGVSVVYLLGVAVLRRDLLIQKRILTLVLVSGVLIFPFVLKYQDLLVSRIMGGGRLEAMSIDERVDYVNDSKDIIADNFFSGVGIGNYSLELAERDEYSNPAYVYQPVHNVFLLIWAEIGFFGVLVFVGVLGYVVWESLKNKSFRYGEVLIFGLVVMFLFDHWLWSMHFGVVLFWVVVGICLKGDFMIDDSKDKL